jgi:two-component system, cell cycle response regulator
MDERTRLLLSAFASGRIPTMIPEDCEYASELNALSSYLTECYQFAMDISNGALCDNHVGLKGMLAGSLKSLHANLRHLTWQTNQIAQGDLTQRIDFLGEFSTSFNCMVQSLEEACAALLHVSTHDSSTGLYNRSYFDTEMARVAGGRCFPVSIMVLDLNGLKEANDLQGHECGDRLIRQAAEVLKRSFRGEDVVARIGGDEFAVIMAGAPEEVVLSAAARIRCRVSDSNALFCSNGDIPLSLALGYAVARDGQELKGALSLADERMYEDKRQHKSRSEIVETRKSLKPRRPRCRPVSHP